MTLVGARWQTIVRIGIFVVAGASPATSATRSRRCVDRPRYSRSPRAPVRRGSIVPILPPFARSSQPPLRATRASPRTTSASADSASRCRRRLGASVDARATRRIPRAVRRVRPRERRPYYGPRRRRPRPPGPTTRRCVGTCIACWRPSREIPPRGDSSGTKIDGEATRKSIPAWTRALPPPLSIVGVRSACGAAGGVGGGGAGRSIGAGDRDARRVAMPPLKDDARDVMRRGTHLYVDAEPDWGGSCARSMHRAAFCAAADVNRHSTARSRETESRLRWT